MSHTMLLRTFFDRFHRPQIKESSAKDIVTQLNHFDRWLGRQATLADLTAAAVEECCSAGLAGGPRSPWANGTASKFKRQIRSVWQRAADVGFVEQPAKLTRITVEQHQHTAWTGEEVSRLLWGCEHFSDVMLRGSGVSLGTWLQAKLRWLYNSGARHDESMTLRRSDFDLTQGVCRIPARLRKNSKAFTVTLTRGTIEGLRLIWESAEGPVFGAWPYDQNQPSWPALDRVLRKVIVLSGLRGDDALRDAIMTRNGHRGVDAYRVANGKAARSVNKDLKAAVPKADLWHKWRRTFATHAYVKTGDIEKVKRWLDHSDIKVTYRYVDWTQAEGESQRDVLSDPVASNLRIVRPG